MVLFDSPRIGVVRYESVMALREQLDRLGKMKGIAQDEKGAENGCTAYIYMNYVQDGLHLLRLALKKQCSNMYSYVCCVH